MSTLQKANCPGGAGQSAKETSDSAIFAQPLEERKREATLMAQLALQGHSVYRVAQDTRISHQVPKDMGASGLRIPDKVSGPASAAITGQVATGTGTGYFEAFQ